MLQVLSLERLELLLLELESLLQVLFFIFLNKAELTNVASGVHGLWTLVK